MTTAYFDCFAGASGDMILGALIDAGLPLERLAAELAKLQLAHYRLSANRVVKQGFAATKFDVLSDETGRPIDHTEDVHPPSPFTGEGRGEGEPHAPPPDRLAATPQACARGEAEPHDHQHGPGLTHAHAGQQHAHAHAGPHRHLADIERIIQAAPLAERVKHRATRIFARLAEAEAKAHGVDVPSVHFHEVGAIDAIIDVVGACLAVELLGIDRVIASPLPPGSGTVRCAHGLMPVPTPATVELLKGVPLAPSRNPGELLTPTGAAVLTTLADQYADALPAGLSVTAVGVGAGSRDGANMPNLLRVFLAEPAPAAARPEAADTVVLMETNLDDIDGVAIGHCFGLLLDAGALDVWATPIMMKKNRPAYKLSVLCEAGSPAEAACRAILFSQTSTFGIREQRMSRTKLAREHVRVETPYGPIRVKVGRLGDAVLQSQPEYEDCREAADATGQSLTEIRRAALDAYRRTGGSGGIL